MHASDKASKKKAEDKDKNHTRYTQEIAIKSPSQKFKIIPGIVPSIAPKEEAIVKKRLTRHENHARYTIGNSNNQEKKTRKKKKKMVLAGLEPRRVRLNKRR